MTLLNRPEIPFALAQMFGIKGKWEVDIDPHIQPSIGVADLANTPYIDYGQPVGNGTTIAANLAEFGYLICTPNATSIFQLRQIICTNATAAAFDVNVRIFTDANITTLGAAINTARLNRMQVRESAVLSGTTVIRTFRNASATIGNVISLFTVPAGQAVAIDFPREVMAAVFGNGGVHIGVNCRTANTALQANFIGREWPLPG